MTRPVIGADVDRGIVTIDGNELERLEVIQLLGELAHALIATAPPIERGWDTDPNREDLSGRIGQKRARQRLART